MRSLRRFIFLGLTRRKAAKARISDTKPSANDEKKLAEGFRDVDIHQCESVEQLKGIETDFIFFFSGTFHLEPMAFYKNKNWRMKLQLLECTTETSLFPSC